ncbi:helicase SRCAP-like, partial [Leucoraja erinacea]|uniref:helicase SRCAP-like n=1 Tax=Leucoraja erinaceus TaxID=7782 RepID=UPI002456CFEA
PAARLHARCCVSHEDQRLKEERARREEHPQLRRIASTVAKEVKHFWTNVEKVVQFKQQSRLEEKRKKALDLQLDFIVGQTEKYSDLLSQSLNESLPASKPGSSSQLSSSRAGSGSACSSPPPGSDSATEDEDFQPQEEDADDEETIEVEERRSGNDAETRRREVELLQRESLLPLEQVLRSLPSPPPPPPPHTPAFRTGQNARRGPVRDRGRRGDPVELVDEEFNADNEEVPTGELPVAELLSKYAKAFDGTQGGPDSPSEGPSDSEGPTDSEEEEEEEEDEEDATSEYEESSSSRDSDDSMATEEDESEESDDEEEEDEEDEIGVEFLVRDGPETGEERNHQVVAPLAKGPKKEITDIAATAESLQPKGYTLATTQVKTPVPSLLRGTLREYQHIGLDWLVTMYEKKLNGILADEMGLGKTIQTIALLAHLAIEKGNWGPHLIIVPTSVMLNWEMECKRWCPAFKILTYYGVQKELDNDGEGWTKPNAFHVCITSYKLVLQDHQAFRRKNWRYMILDEAQNIKNFKSQRWQSLLPLQHQRRLLLTGTPLQNSLMELWSLMHFLMPHVFQSHREFKEWFSNPLTGMIEGSQEYNENLVKRLHKVLRPFLLRRIKVDVEKQMPKKYEHVIQCRLSKRQRYLYDDFMSQASTKQTLETGHFMSVINILMQLRKVCNHPNLFDPRPIHSPFITPGICYTTASCVLRALEYQPFKHVDLGLFDLIGAERRLSKYESNVFLPAHRLTLKMIEEISDAPEPPPRPRPVRMKVNRMLQPPQKPDGRNVLLVNSPRPPLLLAQTQMQTPLPPRPNPTPTPCLRPELLQTLPSGAPIITHSLVSPSMHCAGSTLGAALPLSLPPAGDWDPPSPPPPSPR